MKRITRARPLLGTFVEIWAEDASPDRAEEAIRAAFEEIARVQSLLSYHDSESLLSRINRAAVGESISVDPETFRLFQMIDRLYRESSGLFDVTVAGVLDRIGYRSDVADLPEAEQYGLWSDVELAAPNRLILHAPVRIDLSGIAKGYAVDCAFAVLEARGIESFCVNAGGDLRIRSASAQSVAVRHPAAPAAVGEILSVAEGAVATSAGYYSRRHDALGESVTPLIHPASGKTASPEVSVTVMAPTCTMADALTKVVHADAEASGKVLAAFGAEALILSVPDATMPQLLERRWIAEAAGTDENLY